MGNTPSEELAQKQRQDELQENREDIRKVYRAVNENTNSIMNKSDIKNVLNGVNEITSEVRENLELRLKISALPKPDQAMIESMYGSNYESLTQSIYFKNGDIDKLKKDGISQEDLMKESRKRFEIKLKNESDTNREKGSTHISATTFINNKYNKTQTYSKSKINTIDQ